MTQSLNSRKKLIAISEYHKMADAGIFNADDRIELIEGEILYMIPIGIKHSSIVDRITQLFVTTVLNNAIVHVQNPIQIKNHSEPEPDICLLKPRTDFYSEKHPEPSDILLLVEVSDSTLDFDKNIKLPIYAAAGIAEYWIIDIQNNQIFKHSLPHGKQYKKIEIAEIDDKIACSLLPKISFEVKDMLGE